MYLTEIILSQSSVIPNPRLYVENELNGLCAFLYGLFQYFDGYIIINRETRIKTENSDNELILVITLSADVRHQTEFYPN